MRKNANYINNNGMYTKRGNVKITKIVSDLRDAIVDLKNSKRTTFFKSTIASRKSETIFVIFTLPRFVYTINYYSSDFIKSSSVIGTCSGFEFSCYCVTVLILTSFFFVLRC